MGDVVQFTRRAAGRGAAALAVALSAAACGCGAIEQVANMPTASERRAEHRETEARMRERFATRGDTEAIRWLLAHCIEDGMQVDEVNRILGQEGEFVEADHRLKQGRYHVDDQTWKWGPDDHGKAYFLIFRERKLVNFEPTRFGREAD